MLGFKANLSIVEKHTLYIVATQLKLTQTVPSQVEIAEQLTKYYGDLVTSTSVGTYIQKLKQLELLSKKGKWGAVGSTVSVSNAVYEQAKEWFRGHEEGQRAL